MSVVREFVSTSADPRARGQEFGGAFSDDIGLGVRRYHDLFDRRAPQGFDVAHWANAFGEVIGDLAPDQLAEIEGIAAGSGLDRVDVLMLNARTEILAKADPYGLTSECSAVAVLPADGPAFGAQTWDWYTAMSDGWLSWRLPLARGWVQTVTEYGVLAKIGINDRGLGLLLTILHHKADDSPDLGLPVHLLARRILEESANVAEAVALARATPVAASTSLTVIDAHDAASIELFPGGPGVLRPRDGLLVRTNHFLSDEGSAGCLTAAGYPSTHIRCDRLQGVLSERPAQAPADIVDAMLHHDPEGGVCRHPLARISPALASATLATVTLEPAQRRLGVRAGGPCGGPIAG